MLSPYDGPGLPDQHPVLEPPAEGRLRRRPADQAVRRLPHLQRRVLPRARRELREPRPSSPARCVAGDRERPPIAARPSVADDRPTGERPTETADAMTAAARAEAPVTDRPPPRAAADGAAGGHRRRPGAARRRAGRRPRHRPGRAAPAADSVDAGFSRDMARHHLQGVEMANLALEPQHGPRGPRSWRSTSPRRRPTRSAGCRAGCRCGAAAHRRRAPWPGWAAHGGHAGHDDGHGRRA